MNAGLCGSGSGGEDTGGTPKGCPGVAIVAILLEEVLSGEWPRPG